MRKIAANFELTMNYHVEEASSRTERDNRCTRIVRFSKLKLYDDLQIRFDRTRTSLIVRKDCFKNNHDFSKRKVKEQELSKFFQHRGA